MTILRCQVNIPRDTNIVADDAINTWHFLTVGAATPAAAAADLVTDLGVFYAAIDANISTSEANDIRYKVYDLQDVEPRVPILEATQTLTVSAGAALPSECAVALSYRGPLVSGTNPARRRGRIFIGPLAASVGEQTGGDFRPASAFRTVLANAANDLIVAGTTSDARWVVFSPTDAGAPPWDEGTLEASSVDVSNGWIDNAFDTVRSRGCAPTLRTLFSLTLP